MNRQLKKIAQLVVDKTCIFAMAPDSFGWRLLKLCHLVSVQGLPLEHPYCLSLR